MIGDLRTPSLNPSHPRVCPATRAHCPLVVSRELVLPLIGAHPTQGVLPKDIFQELLSLLQWAANRPSLAASLRRVTVFGSQDTVRNLEFQFGAGRKLSVATLCPTPHTAELRAAEAVQELKQAIAACTTLEPPVIDEARAVVRLATLAAELPWPTCAAARRFGEALIRMGHHSGGFRENL
eukprot:SAG11_NODE_10157_length_851_cov_0.605053_2_plen_180_part_01